MRNQVAAIWIVGIVVALVAYQIGPNHLLANVSAALSDVLFQIERWSFELSRTAADFVRAAAVGLYVVFVALSIVVLRQGGKAWGALVAISVLFYLLVWSSDYDVSNHRWFLGFAVVLIGSLVMTGRLSKRSLPRRNPHRSGNSHQKGSIDFMSVTDTITAGTPFTGLFGGTEPGAISGITPHDWVADANGLYHTATDLKAEWTGIYTKMLNGDVAGLTGIQRLEGNAEAIFENTGLHKLNASLQERDRQDLQREFDAMAGAMIKAGIKDTGPISVSSYLNMEHVLQGDTTLEELGVQGHGLNNPPDARYRGYTNDFQNNVDNKTLYVGPGLDHNEKAIAAFLDDVVLGHAPFPTVFINGTLTQLNQNAAAEDKIGASVEAFNQAAFNFVLHKSDFSTTASTVAPITLATLTPADAPAKPGFQLDYDGGLIPTKLTVKTPHTWVADKDGLYHTTSDLQTEWRSYYTIMLAGHGDTLTAWQRMEGNAEAVFENTGLNNLSDAQQHRDREDIQRQIDAEAGAMMINKAKFGTKMNAPLTQATYLQLEHTLQSNSQLEELALQGHGLNNAPNARYHGYTNDMQNNVDNKTLFVGSGVDHGQKAIADFLDDVILGHLGFPSVFRNGHLVQLNQNGAAENTVGTAVIAFNETAGGRVPSCGLGVQQCPDPDDDGPPPPAGRFHRTGQPLGCPGITNPGTSAVPTIRHIHVVLRIGGDAVRRVQSPAHPPSAFARLVERAFRHLRDGKPVG
eukprot:gene6657-6727_t